MAPMQMQGRFTIDICSKKHSRCQAKVEGSGVTDDEAPKWRKNSDDPCVRTGIHPECKVEGGGGVVGRRVHGNDVDDVVVDVVDGKVYCF